MSELKRFRRTRGRPPKPASERQEQTDLGTPELVMKRAHHVTAEPIDLCHKRGIITDAQHRAALHLRWLHTIRYGAPGITALDLSRGAGAEIRAEDNPAWRRLREHDYNQAITLLISHRYEQTILPCVIYNEYPQFLRLDSTRKTRHYAAQAGSALREAARLAEGLELLHHHWKKQR